MDDGDNNPYDRCNHRYCANPETADAKSAILDSHFYLLTLPRRPVIQRVSTCWLTALYWFHFLMRQS